MADLLKSFRDFVEREQLFTKEDKLLLACSGGLDSTVLAHLLHAEGYDFAIVHMNFQLRGEASDGDAVFVEELARSLDAGFYCKAVDVKGQAQPGESTQMTARWLRYNWFRLILDENGYDRMLTAHHLNDNFETQLINLIRGTGIVGFSGMAPRFGYLVRPLLDCPHSLISDYAESNEVSWREDTSNAEDEYLRNKVRHHLAPIFREKFGVSDKTISDNITNLRGAESFYHLGLEAEKEHRLKVKGEVVTIRRSEEWTFATELTFLHRWVSGYYGFHRDQLEQICRLPDNRFLDSKKFRIFAMPGKWVVAPLTTLSRLTKVVVPNLPYVLHNDHHYLTFDLIKRPISLIDPGVQLLAPPTFPLHLRPRQKGDRFQPLGLGGKTKKVKDYMIDEKIPVWLRDRIYLLTNDQDEIMAIPGYCISENFKVLPEHETVLMITWG